MSVHAVRASAVILGLTLSSSLAVAAPGPRDQGAQLPPGVYPGAHDLRQAPTGKYALDPNHAAIIARVSHLGYSYSVFRFDRVQGALTWNAAAPARSGLSATVKTGSIATNVPGFAAELAGVQYLKSAAFPDATFLSTAFRKTGPTQGKVDGQFTLMGKTRPVTFDVVLVGAGKGFGGHPRIGVEARANIKPKDFGLPPLLGDSIEIVIDTEFEQQP